MAFNALQFSRGSCARLGNGNVAQGRSGLCPMAYRLIGGMIWTAEFYPIGKVRSRDESPAPRGPAYKLRHLISLFHWLVSGPNPRARASPIKVASVVPAGWNGFQKIHIHWPRTVDHGPKTNETVQTPPHVSDLLVAETGLRRAHLPTARSTD